MSKIEWQVDSGTQDSAAQSTSLEAQSRIERSARGRRMEFETFCFHPPGRPFRRDHAQGRYPFAHDRAFAGRKAHSRHPLRAQGPALPGLQGRGPIARRILRQVRTKPGNAGSLSAQTFRTGSHERDMASRRAVCDLRRRDVFYHARHDSGGARRISRRSRTTRSSNRSMGSLTRPASCVRGSSGSTAAC